MTDMREFSRLPEDPAYWDGLAARVSASLAVPLAAERPVWWRPLAARAWPLGVTAAAAVVATLLLVPVPRSGPAPAALSLLGVPPHGPVAELGSVDAPPPLATLLIRTEAVR